MPVQFTGQKGKCLWRYALEYEKDNEEKPFCLQQRNYLNKVQLPLKKRKKPHIRLDFNLYISEFTVYEDVLGKLGMERKQPSQRFC